jgi:hypothetical protein
MARTRPSKGFETREGHRMALVLHALVMISCLLALAVLNRMRTPEVLWVQWAALAWGVVFAVHLWVFSRGTLATMGGAKKR